MKGSQIIITILFLLIFVSAPMTIGHATVMTECDDCQGFTGCITNDGLQKAFFTTGRWGYNTTPARTWEQAIWKADESKPRVQGEYLWTPGVPVDFSVTYNPETGMVTYLLGDKTLTWNYEPHKTFDYIIPFAKGNADGNNVELASMVLHTEAERYICDLKTENNYRGIRIPLTPEEQVHGFTLEGTVTLMLGSNPKDEIPGFHIILADKPKTPVILSYFYAEPGSSEVTLLWRTEAEIYNAGFNIYRSEAPDGAYLKINSSLIPAEGSPAQGATYTFIDAHLQNRKVYYYVLEDIDVAGSSTLHGQVGATPRFIYEIIK